MKKRADRVPEENLVQAWVAVIQRIHEKHNGKIGVESIEGQGSTFFFTIPL